MVEGCELRMPDTDVQKNSNKFGFSFTYSYLCSVNNSLSTRLTYRIMAVVLVMMAVIATVVYVMVREYMLDEAKERYQNMLLNTHEELHRHLSNVMVASENNVHDIERDIEQPDMLFEHMERIVKENSDIACSSILFEPGHYPSKGKVFIPCARRDSVGKVIVSRVDSSYHSYFYDEWLDGQLKADRKEWSMAYFESKLFAGNQKQRLLTTYTIPLHTHEGRAVGLLCTDLSLEFLRNEMMEDVNKMNARFKGNFKHQAYSFVIDDKGTYIIHPDEKRMLRDTLDTNAIMAEERGAATAVIDGIPSWLYYRKVQDVGWTMAVVVPNDVILFNGLMLNITILVVMVLGLLAIYLFCRQQIKGIADPFAMQKANLEHELKIANAIQMAMLPKSVNSPSETIDLYAALAPAREVGGDLYDYFMRDNRLYFCIGDVSGKGVPAALMMALVRAMFRSETRRAESAEAIVDTINHNLSEESTAGYFVTMFVGILDLATGHLDYCNAGHEPPFISGRSLDVKVNLPVGAFPEWNYEGQQTQLNPGDMLFVYTDGLTEAMNDSGELLGREFVQQVAREHASDSARQLVELMEAEVRRHAGNAEQSDDITLLAIKWQDLQLSITASMDDIGQLKPFIDNVAQQADIDTKEAKRLRLAVEEAVANVINYGQATTIRLQATTNDNQLVLTIDDDGQPFDPTADSATDFSVPADERPSGGLGIMFLHEMTDGLEYQRIDGHNILRIRKVKK